MNGPRTRRDHDTVDDTCTVHVLCANCLDFRLQRRIRGGSPIPGGGAVAAAGHDSLKLTPGVVGGDVTADSAVLWAPANREGALTIISQHQLCRCVGRLRGGE
jgi:hypothetical protein